MTPLLKIRNLISDNKIDEALRKMKDLPNGNGLSNELVLITSQHNALRKKIRINTIDFGTQLTESNKIKALLLDWLTLYEEEHQHFTAINESLTNEKDLLVELLKMLDLSLEAYIVQKRLTDTLVKEVKVRLNIKVNDIEKFFFTFFDQLTEEELRIHKTIRAYTEKIMYPNNTQALEIVKDYSSKYDWRIHIPSMELLEEHLLFWKVKFEAMFESTPSMCVVYLLLGEGKGFPVGVEEEINKYMATL